MINIECCSCGVVFAMTDAHNRFRRSDNGDFYCPNGHVQSYTKKEADLLRKTIADRDATILRLGTQLSGEESEIEARDRRINSLKGVITKLKKRGFKSSSKSKVF